MGSEDQSQTPGPDGSAHLNPHISPQPTGENLAGTWEQGPNAKEMPKSSWETVWKQYAPERARMGICFPAVTPTQFGSGFA